MNWREYLIQVNFSELVSGNSQGWYFNAVNRIFWSFVSIFYSVLSLLCSAITVEICDIELFAF